jgi:hypothetical protein
MLIHKNIFTFLDDQLAKPKEFEKEKLSKELNQLLSLSGR